MDAHPDSELACTQLYCDNWDEFDNFADGLPSTQAYGADEGADETGASPVRQCDELACTQFYNEEGEDDLTQEKLPSSMRRGNSESIPKDSHSLLLGGTSVEPSTRSVVDNQKSAVGTVVDKGKLDAEEVNVQAAEILGETLHYENDGGAVADLQDCQDVPAANLASANCASRRPPEPRDDLACTQAYQNESEDDVTAELLQSCKRSEQTELQKAPPSEAEPPGCPRCPGAPLLGGTSAEPSTRSVVDNQKSAVGTVVDKGKLDAEEVNVQAAEILGETLHYENDGGAVADLQDCQDVPAANLASANCASRRPPEPRDDLACTQAYQNESEDDVTAELLQSCKRSEQTELQKAPPSEAEPPGCPRCPGAPLLGGTSAEPSTRSVVDNQKSAVGTVVDKGKLDAEEVNVQAAEILGETLHYENDGGAVADLQDCQDVPAANLASANCASRRPPEPRDDLACTQAYQNESEDDVTAELLQSCKRSEQTELQKAPPSEAEPPGCPRCPGAPLLGGTSAEPSTRSVVDNQKSAVGTVVDKGKLDAEEVNVQAAQVSEEQGCQPNSHEDCHAGKVLGSFAPPDATVADAAHQLLEKPTAPANGICTGHKTEFAESRPRRKRKYGSHSPRMVSVMVQTGDIEFEEAACKPRAGVGAGIPPVRRAPTPCKAPPRLSLLIPKRPRDEGAEPFDVDGYSAACNALWGGRTPQRAQKPSLRDFLAAKQEEVEEADEPLLGTAIGAGAATVSPISSPDSWNVKQEAPSVNRTRAENFGEHAASAGRGRSQSPPSPPTPDLHGERSLRQTQQPQPASWVPLALKQESPAKAILVERS